MTFTGVKTTQFKTPWCVFFLQRLTCVTKVDIKIQWSWSLRSGVWYSFLFCLNLTAGCLILNESCNFVCCKVLHISLIPHRMGCRPNT